jgi:hypothetical protein
MEKMKKYKWYKYLFADGRAMVTRGLSKIELDTEIQKHGKLISKTFAEYA